MRIRFEARAVAESWVGIPACRSGGAEPDARQRLSVVSGAAGAPADFYPVLTEKYAIQIARDWNTKDQATGFVGYVTRFQFSAEFLSRYPVRKVGSSEALELWVPTEELDEFNRQIVDTTEVIHEFRPAGSKNSGDNIFTYVHVTDVTLCNTELGINW